MLARRAHLADGGDRAPARAHLARAIAELKAGARAAGPTDADIDAELAGALLPERRQRALEAMRSAAVWLEPTVTIADCRTRGTTTTWSSHLPLATSSKITVK